MITSLFKKGLSENLLRKGLIEKSPLDGVIDQRNGCGSAVVAQCLCSRKDYLRWKELKISEYPRN